jgi:hypothetical protein
VSRLSASEPKLHRAPKLRTKPKPKPQDLDTLWSMYPALHDSVSRLLEEDDLSFTFFVIDEEKGSIEEYDTNIMGRIKCKNRIKVAPKADGGVKRLLLRYECTLNNHTMPECITNAAKVVEGPVNHRQMIHTQRELHIVSKSGVV